MTDLLNGLSGPLIQIVTLIVVLALVWILLRMLLRLTVRIFSIGCGLILLAGLCGLAYLLAGNAG
jgi:hypothetical protein